MAFFSGEYESKLDAKGRLVLPARLKSHLPETASETIVIVKGFEKCLYVYSQLEWNKKLSQMAGLSDFDEEQRVLQRSYISRSTETDLDALGRFLIPKKMIEYAGLDGEVTVLGVGNRIELWNPTAYEQVQIKESGALSKLAGKYLAG